MAWGLELPKEKRWNPQRDFFYDLEISIAQNRVLRVGRESTDGTSEQIAHVVLTPDEADDLAKLLQSHPF